MKKKSKFRKLYVRRLIIRIIIFLITLGIYLINPSSFEVALSYDFIKEISFLHILWLIWMTDMILQLCKVPKYWPLGSQKFWGHRFIPDIKEIDVKLIKKYMKKNTKECIAVAIVWLLILSIIYVLYFTKIIDYKIVILCM